jgi:hypothetical protein
MCNSTTAKILVFLITLFVATVSVAKEIKITVPGMCSSNPKIMKMRSKELQDLVYEDQKVRSDYFHMTKNNIMKMMKNDLERRKRVGEIFGEGCFNTAKDYMAAALIYQHGTTPDHFFQTFIWANKAAQLGDKNGKQLAALGIDRYLMSIGKKQLFGSQFTAANILGSPNYCFCMVPIESSFPEKFREEYFGRSLKKNYAMLAEVNKGKNCSNKECSTVLEQTPRGTIPGFW